MELVISMEGTPRPWVRPQRAGGYARKTWSKSQNKYVDPPAVAHLAELQQHVWAAVKKSGWKKTDGPVEVEVLFVFGTGKKHKDKAETFIVIRKLGQSSRGDWRTKVPDLDNLTKIVGEALQHGGAIEDDSQITRMVAEKIEYTSTRKR